MQLEPFLSHSINLEYPFEIIIMVSSSEDKGETSTDAKGQKSTGSDKINKIDAITALQDDIDGLSLAMFEALRGLRDAVAPESGNLGSVGNSSTQQNEQQADIDELWQAYKNGDKDVLQQIHAVNGGVAVQKREDFVRIQAKMEMNKDTFLVEKLASTVLNKSAEIDARVDSLPGMERNKSDQMERIQQLLELNEKASEELDAAYAIAKQRRDACRDFVRLNTCKALNIEESDK